MEDVEILQVNTQPGVQSIASLRKEIKALKDQLVGLDAGTKEYNDTLSEVANKTHQLKEIQEQVRRSSNDFGDQLSNVRGTIQGLSGAFQTVLGSLSLMGVEIGDDVKMLKLLNSAMAITQGVAAIDTGVKAFKALTIGIKAATAAMGKLKLALIGSGIGAAAVAVGILVSKLKEEKEAQEEAAEAAKKHNEELREQARVANQLDKATNDYYEEAYKKVPIVEALEKRLADNRRHWQEEFNKGNIDLIEREERIAAERDKYITNAASKMQATWREILSHNTEANWKESEEGKKVWREYYQWRLVAAYGDLEEQKKVMQEWEDFNKKKVDEVKKAATQQSNKEASPIIIPNVNFSEIADAALDEKEQQALTDYYVKKAEIMIAGEENAQEQLLHLEMEYRDQRERLLRERFEKELITKQDFDQQIAELDLEAVELQLEEEEMLTEQLAKQEEERTKKQEEELKKRQALYSTYTKAIKSLTSSITSILGSYSDTLEQGTEQWKAIKIAEATINTIAGGVEAFFSTMKAVGGGPWGIAAGAAAAAAVVASGYAEIDKIRNTDVSGGGSSSSSSSLSNVSPSAVNVNATQVTATRNVQTDEDIANLTDTKVYVLEEDITKAQNSVRVTYEIATY